MARAEARWRERSSAGGAAEAALAFRKAAQANPGDAERWVRLAQAEHLAARTALTEQGGDERESAVATLRRAEEAAERALTLAAPDTARALADDAANVPWPNASPAGLAALYWYARADADASRLSGYGAWAVASQRARELMERLAEQAPELDYGGPDRFLGEYFAMPPVLELEDTQRSRVHFERAADRASQYLGNFVARARSLDVMTQDRAGFEQRLRRVLEGTGEEPPALVAENQLARNEAMTLTQSAADLFE